MKVKQNGCDGLGDLDWGRQHARVAGGNKSVEHFTNFDVLLTVHLSIILVINQLNAQNLVL